MMSKVVLTMALAVLLLDSIVHQTGANCSLTLFFVPAQRPANLSLSGRKLDLQRWQRKS